MIDSQIKYSYKLCFYYSIRIIWFDFLNQTIQQVSIKVDIELLQELINILNAYLFLAPDIKVIPNILDIEIITIKYKLPIFLDHPILLPNLL